MAPLLGLTDQQAQEDKDTIERVSSMSILNPGIRFSFQEAILKAQVGKRSGVREERWLKRMGSQPLESCWWFLVRSRSPRIVPFLTVSFLGRVLLLK